MSRIDIADLAKQRGSNMLRFRMPAKPLRGYPALGIGFTSSDDIPTVVQCVACEDRYKLAEGYKMTLQPVDAEGKPDHRFAYEHFYQRDFESLAEKYPDEYGVIIPTDDIH